MPRSLTSPSALDELLERLDRVAPASTRQWGTMTPHEMLCHLADSLRAVMGERPVPRVRAHALTRRLMRVVALRTPVPWPHGIPTMAEVDPKRRGTRPTEFDADRARLVDLMRRFASPDATRTEHPMFGPMSLADRMIWGYRHTDHHLRQFGV